MAPEFKLTYFNLKGIAEPIRFIFHYANVEFEDCRLERDNWSETKDNYPWSILPLLEETNGSKRKLSQSFTIGRYLGKRLDLKGKDSYEDAKCDEYGEAIKDLLNECRGLFVEPDETKKAEILQNIISVHAPKFLGKFDKDLIENKFLVGNRCTWIDFFAAYYFDFFERFISPDLFDSYPHAKAYKSSILAIPQIKAWIERRPVTSM